MDRLFARLVTVLTTACLFLGLSACQMLAEDLPKPVWIDDTFSDEQEQAVQKAIEEWNSVGREYLGYDIIIYQGRYVDSDGFSPQEDFEDGYNVIYNVKKADKWYDYLVQIYLVDKKYGHYDDSGVITGFGTVGDILIFDFSISSFHEIEEDEGYSDYLHHLRYIQMHEFGHWFGLMHINFTDSDGSKPVMSPEAKKNEVDNASAPFLTKLDIQAFCLVYDCVKQP